MILWFKELWLVKRQIYICPWQFIPVVSPGMMSCMVWNTGLLSYTCPLHLFRKGGNYWDNYFVACTVPSNAVQSQALGLLFQSLTLHGHAEQNWKQTQLPVQQLIRRSFRWVRHWRGALAWSPARFKSTSPSNSRNVFSTLHRPCLLIFGCLQFFSSFISFYIVLFFPVSKKDFLLLLNYTYI